MVPPFDASDSEVIARKLGRSRTGTVSLRDFDEGVAITLGAEILPGPVGTKDKDGNLSTVPSYFIPRNKIEVPPAPGLPGIQVTFAFPEDVFRTYRVPMIVIRRDDFTPAMARWEPGTNQYTAPSATASQVNSRVGVVYNRLEWLQQATPFDISYSIQVLGRDRSALLSANKLLLYVLRRFPPVGSGLLLRDSLKDWRSYEAFMEGTSSLDTVPEITERVIGFAVSVRVEGELDLLDPTEGPAAYKDVNIAAKVLKRPLVEFKGRKRCRRR